MVQMFAVSRRGSESKAHRRQLEILAAASRAFRRQGLHATGMRDIAAESNMHVGNLYYYFRNKQELLAFCQHQTLAGLIELIGRIDTADSPADGKLFDLIVGHVVLLNEDMPGSLAHLEVEALEEPWRENILAARDRYEKGVRRIVRNGIRSGVFRPADEGIAARGILGAVNWTVKWFSPGGSQTTRQIGAELARMLVGGLLAPGRRLTQGTSDPVEDEAERGAGDD